MWRAANGRMLSGRKSRERSLSTIAACRAVLVPRFGRPDVLEVRDGLPVPDLKPKEVLVRSRAVSINPLDLRMRAGYGRSIFEPLLPIIIGRDVSGEIAATGSSVTSLKLGDEVFGALHPTAVRGTYTDYAVLSQDELALKPTSLSHVEKKCLGLHPTAFRGTYTNYVVSSENELALKPSSISHVEASAIPFAALTAWRALHSTARISQGQKLLVIGGGGAVGFAAIQLAVAAGCTVITTCGPHSVDRVLTAGAQQAVDYTSQDVESSIKDRFDAVLDTIGGPETERIGIYLLKKGGHYMTLQGEAASLADRYGLAIGLPAATAMLLKKQLQYRYSHGIEYQWTYMRADPEGLDEIRRLSQNGKLHIPVEKTFPLNEVKKAHEAKEKRLVPGKVVLEFD